LHACNVDVAPLASDLLAVLGQDHFDATMDEPAEPAGATRGRGEAAGPGFAHTSPSLPQITMATMSRLLLLAFASIALASIASAAEPPAPPSARMSSAECEVWARELSFAQSVADHDAAAFASHVEPDAAFSAESPQPLRGRDQITRQWSGLIAGKGLLLSWYPTRTTIGGVADVASSSGPALYEDPRPGAKQRFRLGAFHSVWHCGQDGVWRVLFDGGQEPVAATEAEAAAFKADRRIACPGQA
jgi:ketosteroid isomerase-like protein